MTNGDTLPAHPKWRDRIRTGAFIYRSWRTAARSLPVLAPGHDHTIELIAARHAGQTECTFHSA